METVSKNTDATEPQTDETISETVSKKKRGRPQTVQRQLIEIMPAAAFGSGSQRNRMNEQYALTFWGHVAKAPEEEQIAVLGKRWNQCIHHFPKGSVTAATEIGRYMEWCCETKDNESVVYQQVVTARREGYAWTHIKAWYRQRRLGVKEGNAVSLTLELCRTIDSYRKRFPGTTQEVFEAALRNAFDSVCQLEE